MPFSAIRVYAGDARPQTTPAIACVVLSLLGEPPEQILHSSRLKYRFQVCSLDFRYTCGSEFHMSAFEAGKMPIIPDLGRPCL